MQSPDHKHKNFGIYGFGKMGQSIAELLPKYGVKSIDVFKKGGDLAAFIMANDTIIDFSCSSATHELLVAISTCSNKKLLIGTTALTESSMKLADELSSKIAIFISPNTSIGVNALKATLKTLVARLGSNFDVEILETHHRFKLDSPSGTALMLAQEILDARGSDKGRLLYGDRSKSAKEIDEIGIASMRSGNVIGEHKIVFSSSYEQVTIEHRAFDRRLFADGAIQAALWLQKHKDGLFSMDDFISDLLML